MINILLLRPMYGNGGIKSWADKYVQTFPNAEFNIVSVSSVIKAKSADASVIRRFFVGICELLVILIRVIRVVKRSKIEIFHATTSGSYGSLRDYVVGYICKKQGVKTILHCHYGCMVKYLTEGGIKRRLLMRSLKQYDQIWVLDRTTYNYLNENVPIAKGRVYITPNSINVDKIDKIPPKSYCDYAFIANVLPTKGIFELLQAFTSIDDNELKLHIVGPSSETILKSLNEYTAKDSRIKYYGRVDNNTAIQYLKGVDALVLPTYFPGEAFPISILEAMSFGKFVISTPRAAIRDMLTSEDGEACGYLVNEQSVSDIVDAIKWCRTNPHLADDMCERAYAKVYNSYRMDVVYDLYRNLYRKIIIS